MNLFMVLPPSRGETLRQHEESDSPVPREPPARKNLNHFIGLFQIF